MNAEAPSSFILKMGRADQMSSIARSRRWKEHEFYTRLASVMDDPPVPRPYAAAFDSDKQRSHLLLEDLTSTHRSPPAAGTAPASTLISSRASWG